MLLAEKQYADAEAVFSLLCFLNPHVFDYWFAKGSCEHAQGSIDAAIESYTQSLFIEPTNPVPFFELADCFYQDSDLQSCMKTLEYCIELCAEDPQHEALMNEARSYLQDLRTKKAA